MAQNDFYFHSGQSFDLGTPKQRFENNKQVIQLAKELASTRRSASPEEQVLLSKYVGWGDSRLASRVHELTDLLTEDELRSARGSTLNAHYTALPVIGAMWEAALQLGFGERPFRVLDPSAGIGHFKSMTSESLREMVDWTEIELDGLTAAILKALHPTSRIFNMGFEAANLPDGVFDLAISNVPFGDFGVFSKKLPKYLTNPIHDFFCANTWSLLRPGGVLMYITSRFTLDKKDDRVRKWLARRFDLLAAVRLPETAFEENAGTKVVTDILIMQKRIEETEEVPLWVNTGVFKPDYRTAMVNQYYLEHPEMIIGVPSMDGRMYQSDGYTVLPAGMDLLAELSRTYKRVLKKLELVTTLAKEDNMIGIRKRVVSPEGHRHGVVSSARGRKEELMGPKTTRQTNDTTVSLKLYLALELSQVEWKLGFTIGLGQAPRLRTMKARDPEGLKREIELAKVCFGLKDFQGFT